MWEVSLYFSGFHTAFTSAIRWSHIKHSSCLLHAQPSMCSHDTHCGLPFSQISLLLLLLLPELFTAADCPRAKVKLSFGVIFFPKYLLELYVSITCTSFPHIFTFETTDDWLLQTGASSLFSILTQTTIYHWSSLQVQIKCPLFEIKLKKAMTMNFPTCMPLSFGVFRVQEVSLLSHLTNVDDPHAFPVFFTHLW